MKVVEFQLQTLDTIHPREHLSKIDLNAPIPQLLEGGNFKGPLYQCILDAQYLDILKNYCASNTSITLYTEPCEYELEDTLYKSNTFVQWQFGKPPTTETLQ